MNNSNSFFCKENRFQDERTLWIVFARAWDKKSLFELKYSSIQITSIYFKTCRTFQAEKTVSWNTKRSSREQKLPKAELPHPVYAYEKYKRFQSQLDQTNVVFDNLGKKETLMGLEGLKHLKTIIFTLKWPSLITKNAKKECVDEFKKSLVASTPACTNLSSLQTF